MISLEYDHFPNEQRYQREGPLKLYTVGVKSMSPVDIKLLFVMLCNYITTLHHNINIFLWKSSNLS